MSTRWGAISWYGAEPSSGSPCWRQKLKKASSNAASSSVPSGFSQVGAV